MATIIRMPSVLAGSEEAAIATWLVTEGQSVAIGDPLAEIETEKAIVEYNSEDAGVVGRVLLEAGQSGEIGIPIAVLLGTGEGDAEIDALLGSGGGAEQPALVAEAANTPDVAPRDPDGGTPIVEAPSQERAAEQAVPATVAAPAASSAPAVQDAPATAAATAPATTTAAAPAATPQAETDRGDGRLFVSPIARKLARERGLDPAAIVGTGPGGRIVRRDVESAPAAAERAPEAPAAAAPALAAPVASAAPAAPASAPAPSTEWDLVPHTGMRKAIARRLTESKSTVPHFYLTTDCLVDDLLALRKQVNESSKVRVSVNDFVVKAVAAAFAEVPEASVTWSDEGMRVHHAVDIAVAVATEGGLVTPVVRGVDSKSLTAVSSTIAELVGRAKDKKLKQDELEGGSFSVSNLGMYGTREFSAILNPPQSGILAVGAATPQAVVKDGEIVVATVMRCTLSVDHRAVDGALAARWLAAFTDRIQNPLSILL
ncbi:dihydrolipoamide acetyltransferase family protein [Subtercola sp. YIM 133946]|uniref:dihydrolipoamide acetyltransferase family protein n=1 Tax=Subtercola sp. YIM 133946 TaxID=3118909 RepID=UPI002F9229C9